MDIQIRLAFDEHAAVRLLNWLADENTRIIRGYDRRFIEAQRDGRPGDLLPLLYESGVVYRREAAEVWCDYLLMLAQGWEDCDGLSAARAGELRARGWRALAPKDPNDELRYPGDAGYAYARANRVPSIKAQVVVVTRVQPGQTGLYHCIVKYAVGDGRIYYDDPSARLGMYDADAGDESYAHLRSRPTRRPPGFPRGSLFDDGADATAGLLPIAEESGSRLRGRRSAHGRRGPLLRGASALAPQSRNAPAGLTMDLDAPYGVL